MASKEKDELLESKPYTYFEQSVTSKVHHYYLSESIGEPTEYVELIHRIKTSGPSEMIHLHLNTPGGRLDTGVQIINAMQTSEAHIVCSLESKAHSLGTLIFLAADEFIVHDNCMMMFHNYSGGMWGKGNEQVAQLDATVKWFNTLARHVYQPFLSEDEVSRILKGEDLWLHTDDIRKRLVAMVKTIEKELKTAEKALQSPPKKKAAKKKAAPKKKSTGKGGTISLIS